MEKDMKAMTELERKNLEIVILKKKVSFLEGIVDGLVKD